MLEMKKENLSLKEQTERIIKKGEELLDVVMECTGCSNMDMLLNMDKDTAVMYASMMSLYKDMKELSIDQAEALDSMMEYIGKLKATNERLLKQNYELQTLLQKKK